MQFKTSCGHTQAKPDREWQPTHSSIRCGVFVQPACNYLSGNLYFIANFGWLPRPENGKSTPPMPTHVSPKMLEFHLAGVDKLNADCRTQLESLCGLRAYVAPEQPEGRDLTPAGQLNYGSLC